MPTPVWFGLLDESRFVAKTEERTAKGAAHPTRPTGAGVALRPTRKPLGPGVEGTARILHTGEESQRAEAALDRHYGRTRRIYEKLMADQNGMVYLSCVGEVLERHVRNLRLEGRDADREGEAENSLGFEWHPCRGGSHGRQPSNNARTQRCEDRAAAR